MPRRITPQTTLDTVKREAKRWLKALRDNVADAHARLERALTTLPANPTLRDVQHALAREHGFDGWAELKRQLAERKPEEPLPEGLVDTFIANTCPDHHVRGPRQHVRAASTAMRLLAQYPELVHATPYTEIVCGDLVAVQRIIAIRPDFALQRSSEPAATQAGVGEEGDLDHHVGPKGWEPLLYCCFTRLPLARANDNALAIARLLLDAGANPNAFFMAGGSRYTPLVGAFGEGEEDRPPHPQRDELVRLLLEAGAEPYDIQVVYNIRFHGRVQWFLETIYDHSVKLGRKADWDDPDWGMLDMGGYGNGARWHLAIAIDHNDIALARWCLEHGANPNAGPARAKQFPQVSLYEDAVRKGCDEIAGLLLQHGATPETIRMTDAQRFTAAALGLDGERAHALISGHRELLTVADPMLAAARQDRVDVVGLLLDLGMSPDVEDHQKQRGLHVAAYNNAIRVAQLLIDRGAEIDPREQQWGNTPLSAAAYAQHQRMIDLFAPLSRDVWELALSGKVTRLQEVLAEQPERARVTWDGHTLLMWLPPHDEDVAIRIAEMLIAKGANPSAKNTEGMTAADRAERLGMPRLVEFLHGAVAEQEARPTIERFEQMVTNLLEAYRTGTPEAMERHWNDTWHRRAWDAMKRYVRADLGKRETVDVDITPEEAQLLVAREQGFKTWEALVEYVTHLPAGKRLITARPIGFYAAGKRSHAVTSRDWEEAAELIVANRFDGVRAHGQMTDEALEHISRLGELTTIDLSDSKRLTDAGIQHLARMPQLRHLSLSSTAVTDEGLQVLRELPGLESVRLEWTRVTDAGISALSGCERLQRVELAGTSTGDGALKALAGKPVLSHFRSGSGVTNAGLALLHEFPVFKSWQGGEIGHGLTSPEAEPNSLMLRGSFTDRGMEQLVGLDGLYDLNVWDVHLAITAAGLRPLVKLANLGMLSFAAHDDAMPIIARMPKLRMLMIQDTGAGDDGFVALSASRSIERIWGRRCHNLRSRGFRALANMPALRGLSVSCLNVDDDALSTLPSFPSLTEIMPMDVPDEGYRHIAKCPKLESLVLMYCRDTTDRATEHLAGLPRLRKYLASYTQITDRTPVLLSGIDSLEEVTFSSCAGLTNDGIATLARLPRLRKLEASGSTGVTEEVWRRFAPGIRVDPGE